MGSSGRRVECGVCHEVWSGGGVESPAAETPPLFGVDDSLSSGGTAQDLADVGESTGPVAAPLFVERAAPSRKGSGNASRRLWTLVVLTLVVAIVAGVFVFRRDVERAFPGAPAFYHSLGLRSVDRAGG